MKKAPAFNISYAKYTQTNGVVFLTEAKSLNTKRRGGSRGQSLVQGAAILTFGTILVKVIGAIFKIPLGNVIGEAGMGYFSAAYALYLPVYTLSAAGFPSALARQVAENTAMGRYKDARKVHRVAQRVFLITGILGFIAMAAGGFVYINFVDRDSIYSVLAMSPSVFFCCMMASYRGYYEGLRNMTPTAVSQVIEALGKLFIGLGLAIGIMKYGEYSFQTSLTAYGTTVNTLEEARIASYPFAAAGSLAGIALGSLAGLIYMLLRSRKYGDELTDEEIASSPAPRSTGYILRNFFSIGIPIALGVLVLNVTQVIDAITIQNRLDGIDPGILRGIYRNYMSGVTDDKIPNFLYGAYNFGINLYNLVPYITQALGVSALPTLAAAWAIHKKSQIHSSINSVIKISVLIGFPSGLGMCALAGPILQLLYPGKPAAEIAVPMLRVLGIMVLFGSLVTPINSMLQAVGKQKVPVYLMLIGASIKLLLNFTLVGIPEINIKGAPIGSISCYIFIVVASLIILYRRAKIRPNLMTTFIKPLFAAIMCALTAWVTYGLLDKLIASDSRVVGALMTVIAIVAAIAVYVFVILLIKGMTKEDVLMIPKGEKIANILEKKNFI